MNVRKFIAATARDALRKVRETLGPDAIILSNRGIPGGVEIMAVAARDMEMIVPTDRGRGPGAAADSGPSPGAGVGAARWIPYSSFTAAAGSTICAGAGGPTTGRERSTAGGGRGSRRSDGRDSHIAKDCRTATGRLCLGRGSTCATDKDRDSSPHA